MSVVNASIRAGPVPERLWPADGPIGKMVPVLPDASRIQKVINLKLLNGDACIILINIGSIVSERECDQPKPSDPSQTCQGSSQKVQLCEDVGICKDKERPSVNDYAGLQCAKFSKRLPVIDSKGVGRQAEYSPSNHFSILCFLIRTH